MSIAGLSTIVMPSIRIPTSTINSSRTLISMSRSSLSSSKSATATSATGSGSVEIVAGEDEKHNMHPWLIVGLGNPGQDYIGTRHNIGFEFVDRLAEAAGISIASVQFKALFGKGFIGNVPIMLAKPQTFMNLSGQSVGAILSYYKIPLKQLLVVYDDMDLPFAKLRLLPKGGHGGHNGMRSIIDHVNGNRDFPRLRIGIGRPPGKMDGASYVMSPFSKQERQELDFTLQAGIEAVRILLLEGFDRSASLANSPKPLEQLG